MSVSIVRRLFTNEPLDPPLFSQRHGHEACSDAERFVFWARQLLDQTKRKPAEHVFDLAARLLTDSFFERRVLTRDHDSLTGDDVHHVCIAHVYEAAYRELSSLRIAFQHDVIPPPVHHATEYVQLAGILLGQRDEMPKSGPLSYRP